MGAQVVGPLWQTLRVQQQHAQESSAHTDGVVGRPTAWAWGIACAYQGTRGVQSESEEHECGLVPRLREATGLMTEPALEFGRHGGALRGMRWDQRCFLLGHKGKPRFDSGLIVLPFPARGKAPWIF
jgi:hypothetical protein